MRQFFESLIEVIDKSQGCNCERCDIRPHASDCAVHNMPAYPNGPCDCFCPDCEGLGLVYLDPYASIINFECHQCGGTGIKGAAETGEQ